MRVAIVGNSGSGKSMLARRIADGVPVLDLDTVAWEPQQIAVPRDPAAAIADVHAFCSAHADWIVEGCYAGLVAAALEHDAQLVFLDPGLDACVANCRARPWEPHKYPDKAEQDRHLDFLLAWVADYYVRDGDMSRAAHVELFERYAGPKLHLVALPDDGFTLP